MSFQTVRPQKSTVVSHFQSVLTAYSTSGMKALYIRDLGPEHERTNNTPKVDRDRIPRSPRREEAGETRRGSVSVTVLVSKSVLI